ncbi:hypothetical protein HR060_09170 [Catenovulum sp. SM1970]|uniref:hypothetical protein n=1 Tax=Marinifaba aquimaris TaxID=2741323 RepID=UPI0015730F8D|nr:hypothetical protein [Marinifaba aquimaris]NTS77042.1 hypothetical protein [Marinifaba aquimaris]
MNKTVNLSSLYQALFSILLAVGHFTLCELSSQWWIPLAVISSFWFFLILPVCLTIVVVQFVWGKFNKRPTDRTIPIYIYLTAISFYIFVTAVNQGCYLSA